MYQFLVQFLPPLIAEIVLVAWYAVLLLLIVLFFNSVPGNFVYGAI